jgi:hypothetical protein
MGALPGETVVAMNGFGRKGVGAVQGHQYLGAKGPTIGPHAVLFQACKDLHKHRRKVARRDGIAPWADLMVTGKLLHAQQGRGVMVTLGLLTLALGLQQRRRWGEKEAQGAQGGIVDGIAGVWPLGAMVRPWSDPSVQDALEGLEASGVWQGYLLGPREITT